MSTTYYWTASNNSSFLNGRREAKTLLGAIRAARKYVNDELYGEGRITIYDDEDCECPIKSQEKSLFTNYKWVTQSVR